MILSGTPRSQKLISIYKCGAKGIKATLVAYFILRGECILYQLGLKSRYMSSLEFNHADLLSASVAYLN